MIVTSLTKSKRKNEYIVIIDYKDSYKFSEEVILEYRLVKGKEVTSAILNEALSKQDISKYQSMALNYAYKYQKSEQAIRLYLAEKGCVPIDIAKIIEYLKSVKAINDINILDNLVYSLVKKYNGRRLIEQKLYDKGFEAKDISIAIENINLDDYYEALEKLYKKVLPKYDLSIYKDKCRLYNYLLSKGYLLNEIKDVIE